MMYIDFKNHVDEWNKVETSDVVIVPDHRHEEAGVFNAKRAELNNWKAFTTISKIYIILNKSIIF